MTTSETPAYPIDYAHAVQLFTRQTTAEQRVFIYQHLLKPLRHAFPQLDDVSAGTLACQLYPGLTPDVNRMTQAVALGVMFLKDTCRIAPEDSQMASTKIASLLHGVVPLWLEHWSPVRPTVH